MKSISVNVRNLIKTVAFLVILFFVLLTLSYMFRPYSGSASRKNICGFYAEKDNSLDVVVVGASSTFAFFEPMEFWKETGIAAYNFSTSNLPPQCVKYCLKEIQKTQDPKLYVIDIKNFIVAENGYYQDYSVTNMDHEVPLRNIIDNVKYSKNRLDMIENCLPETITGMDKLAFYIDLMKYHTEYQSLIDIQNYKFATNESHDYAKGFKLHASWRPLEDVHDYTALKKRAPVSERVEDIFRDLIEYIKEEDLPVVFVTSVYNQTKKHKKRFNYMADIIWENGYDFVNANNHIEEMGIDYETDFYDNDHVNVFGAEKFTKYIGSWIQERADLPDHRGEAAYASWDQDYELWSADVAKTKEIILEKIANHDSNESAEKAAQAVDGE